MRQTYKLTNEEWRKFNRLEPELGVAFAFWWAVANDRKLDSSTLLSERDGKAFSGLPLGHGKHWCYPHSLQCKNPPSEH